MDQPMQKLARRAVQLIAELDEALAQHRGNIRDAAEKEHAYRMAKSKAMLRLKAGDAKMTVAEMEAKARLGCSRLRLEAKLADGIKEASSEAMRTKRAQLSGCQSLLSTLRSEMELAR